jgi:hypothetical protein
LDERDFIFLVYSLRYWLILQQSRTGVRGVQKIRMGIYYNTYNIRRSSDDHHILRLQRAEETGIQGPDIDPLCYADLESLIMPMEGLLILGLRRCNRESQFQIPELSSPELKCQGAPPHRSATSGRTKVCHRLVPPYCKFLISCVPRTTWSQG